MENPRNLEVGAIFNESKRLIVPIYQRTYEWTVEKQVASLFDYVEAKADVRLSGESRRLAHYMGALLLIPRGKWTFGSIPVFDIVDGQQRLTTFQIFLAALYDLARLYSFEGIANQIKPALYNTDESSMQDRKVEKYKLEPTRYDRAMFRDLIDLGAAELPKKYPDYFYKNGNLKAGSAPKSLQAFWHLRGEADAFIKESGEENTRIRLLALLQALLEDLKLIVITLGLEDDAQVIFETLNSGGEPLAAMDLVRNDVFHRAIRNDEDPEELMDARWSRFETSFWKEKTSQGRIKKPRIDFFLANVLAAETGKEALLTELYAAYKQFAAERKFPTVDAELQTLLRHGTTYERILNQTGSDSLASLSRTLNRFDVSTAIPLALVIEASSADESTKAAMYRMMESYIVRRALCNLTPKNFNKTFVRLSGILREQGASPTALAAGFLSLEGDTVSFPSATRIEEAIARRPTYQDMPAMRLRYILGELERHVRGGFDETEGLRNDLQIEHVLPDSWMEHWPLPDGTKAPASAFLIDDEAQRAFYYRREGLKHTLGNLTLLTAPANKHVRNYSYAESKRSRLRDSLLRMNQDIAASDQWDETGITERGQRLAELINRIWPVPDPSVPST